MSIDQQYLWDVLNSVWEEGLTELEVQRRYFSILEKELKGEDRGYLIEVYNHIEELELKEDSETILTNIYKEK
tara:strand:- start:891 stop:1109 length:219 start_codon:yes stop_codon:yes gene_type:complete